MPGECYGQRSLGGYSPRGRKELDTTEQLNNNISCSEDPICDSAHTHVTGGLGMQWMVDTPTAPAVEVQSLNHWTTRDVPLFSLYCTDVCKHVCISNTCVYFLPARLPSRWQCLEGRCRACLHLWCLLGLAVTDAWECGRKSWGHSCVRVLACSCVSAEKA